MKKLLMFLGALATYGQTVSLSDTLTHAVGGGSFTGRVTVTLNSPGNASPLYYSTTSLTGWQAVYCLGVTGADCTTTTSAGTFAATLYANSTITPAGTSYSARFQPAKGAAWSETWTVEASDTKLYEVRSTTVPSPTTTFQASQLTPGTNGQVLSTVAGATAWAAPGGVTSIAGTAYIVGVSSSGGNNSSLAEVSTRLSEASSGTPASATAACTTGAGQFDSSYIYVCHATNTWKRAAVATW
jgi:hypothetical protein